MINQIRTVCFCNNVIVFIQQKTLDIHVQHFDQLTMQITWMIISKNERNIDSATIFEQLFEFSSKLAV